MTNNMKIYARMLTPNSGLWKQQNSGYALIAKYCSLYSAWL